MIDFIMILIQKKRGIRNTTSRHTEIVVAKYVSLSFPLKTPPMLYTDGYSVSFWLCFCKYACLIRIRSMLNRKMYFSEDHIFRNVKDE